MKKTRRVGNGGLKSVQQITQQDAIKPGSSSPSTTKIHFSHRRKSKRRSAARTATPRSALRELAVYDGTDLVGIIKVAVDGGPLPSTLAASAWVSSRPSRLLRPPSISCWLEAADERTGGKK